MLEQASCKERMQQMKSYELKATPENLLKTYQCDAIGRNADIFRFVSLLDSIEDSCSIALNGDWGSGKIFFVKQVKMVIGAYNPFLRSMPDGEKSIIEERSKYYFEKHTIQPQVCVYYDAWENDNDEDPILSIIHSILTNVASDFSFKGDFDLKGMLGPIVDLISGKNLSSVMGKLDAGDPFDTIRKSKSLKNSIGEFLNSLILEKGNRLVIIIDELDRCKPDYAVKVLERIKHYFDNDNITFVFAVNTNELQHTIKQSYGASFDACRYLNRFFDLPVELPSVDTNVFLTQIGCENKQYTFDIMCHEVIRHYGFSLREITKFLRVAKVAAYKPTHEDVKRRHIYMDVDSLLFVFMQVLPIMLGLKLHDTVRYKAFRQGKDSTPLLESAKWVDFRFFNALLTHDESFGSDQRDENYTLIHDRLESVYNALFVVEYNMYQQSINIGQCRFNEALRGELLRIESSLSDDIYLGD